MRPLFNLTKSLTPARLSIMSSRPTATRTASTNLGAGSSSTSRILEGKLAIVTGASRGIGAAIATNLASKGANLVLNFTSDSSSSKTSSLAESLSAEHSIRAIPVQADMAHASGPSHLIDMAKNHFSHPKSGTFQIDILINNAGVAGDSPVGKITAEQFNKMYAVNVLGPLQVVQAALPYLPNDRSGRIVNVSSVSSSCGFEGQTVYGGTKAALEAMTRTWSRELAERATVNAVNPGPVATDMWGGVSEEFMRKTGHWVAHTPLAAVVEADSEETKKQGEILLGRPGWDHEIAGTVGMLCTPDAGWTTGSVVCSNGGMVFSSG